MVEFVIGLIKTTKIIISNSSYNYVFTVVLKEITKQYPLTLEPFTVRGPTRV